MRIKITGSEEIVLVRDIPRAADADVTPEEHIYDNPDFDCR